ncbi:MAG: tetratricopeptide repeat protein [Bacteroidales bacterium]|nr:tetratricopeptide repeat protein [Bacteroidales bacterium]
MKNVIFYAILIFLGIGCATNDLTIQVTEPAPIDLPGTVKNIAIINRTNTISANQAVKDIDEILTLEMLTVDSTAALKAIEGLNTELNLNPRFDAIVNLSPQIFDNNNVDRFSQPLSQSQVTILCTDNNVDALFVLEFFDTNTKVDYSVVPVQTNVLGVNINAVETQATATTNIMLGWRIYDASGGVLFDEFPTSGVAISSGRGINPLKAINAVIGQKNLVEQVSFQQGLNYGQDLLPFSHRVGRIYYVKGTDNFKIGKRLARAGKWDDAASYWQKEVSNSKAKIAGRAYYNMAIISEINGDLDAAINWAEQSYTLFNNKKALRYLNVLRDRKLRNNQLLRQQSNY